MRTLNFRVLMFALVLVPCTARAGELPPSFSLGRYIPDDVWVFVDGAHNPEREFIDRNWARVFEAVKQSGIGGEVKSLIVSQLDARKRDEFEQHWQTIVRLYNGVEWCQLGSAEMAFGMRFSPFPQMPACILLMRSAADSNETNFTGLKRILETVASLSPDESKLTDEELSGVHVSSLQMAEGVFVIDLFRRGDIIGVTTSRAGTRQVLTLMRSKPAEGEPPVKAIVDQARFKHALSEVPSPKDAVSYLDLHKLFSDLNAFLGGIAPRAAGKEPAEKQGKAPKGDYEDGDGAQVINILTAALDQCDLFDYAITTELTDGMQTRSEAVCRLRSEAADKPLVKLFTGQKPFEQFDRFLPADVTAFDISSGANLSVLYDEIMRFVHKHIPDGEQVVATIHEHLAELKFDPKRDLLDWFSGETIAASLPAAMKSPFGGGDFVWFFRVKDAKLAAAKIEALLNWANDLLKGHDAPALLLSDASEVSAKGFRSITHPMVAMMGIRMVYGFSDDWLVIGSSPSAVNKCLLAGNGKRPTIASNPRFQKEGIVPTGAVASASFKDLSSLGQELGSALMGMSFASAMIPDEPKTKPIKSLFGILGRLGPAVAQIDFFSSESSATTFDGKAWRTKAVVTYRNPPKPED